MKKRFLGIICILYSGIIIYVWTFNQLKNFLAPNMQIYLKLSLVPLLIMGLILCFNNKVNYKFKISDIILILPLIMLILSGDGRLTTTLATNRMMIHKTNNQYDNNNKAENNLQDQKIDNSNIQEELLEDANESTEESFLEEQYDFTDTYFNVVDESYDTLANYLSYVPNATVYEGKTIRVRGFIVKQAYYLNKNQFAIGKYSISCCVADAGFIGFIVNYNPSKVKENAWYEIEGVLQKDKDKDGVDILSIKVVNIKEIDSKKEEQYVYPCYAYDNGMCNELRKYNLQ